MQQQLCHVSVGYALHLRMLRIEMRGSRRRPFASRRRIFPRLGRQRESPPPVTAEAHKRAGTSSSRALAGHSAVPAAMLVDETPTLALLVAAPVVTASASRMRATSGSQGKLVRPVCAWLLFLRWRTFSAPVPLLRRVSGLPILHAVSANPRPATCNPQHAPFCRSPSSALQSIDDFSVAEIPPGEARLVHLSLAKVFIWALSLVESAPD